MGKDPVLMQFKQGTYNLDIAKLVGNKAKTISPVNALSIKELWRKSHSEKKKRKRAHLSVTFHRKWSFPIATIIFSALAVPLAILTGKTGSGLWRILFLRACCRVLLYRPRGGIECPKT